MATSQRLVRTPQAGGLRYYCTDDRGVLLEATARATKQPSGRRNIPASATSLTARTDESIGVARWIVGLDAIEIIRLAEDAFDVRIEDAEVEKTARGSTR